MQRATRDEAIPIEEKPAQITKSPLFLLFSFNNSQLLDSMPSIDYCHR
jgi:hypothetical protein